MIDHPTVLFDFDGTVADTIPLIIESYRHTLVESDLPSVDEQEMRSWIGRPLRDVFAERYPGRGPELTATYRRWNLAHHDELICAVDGMPQLLTALTAAGRRIGVVSSKNAPTIERGLRAVGLDGLIDIVAAIDDTAAHKPSPAPLLFAADRLGVAPDSCAYIGDATVDMIAAGGAGMTGVGVTWGAASRVDLVDAGADLVVDAIPELEAAFGIRPA